MKAKLIRVTFLFSIIMIFQCKTAIESNNFDKLIKGAWAENQNDNVKFIIDKKNIQYFDTDYLYSYSITSHNELLVLDSSKIVLKFEIIRLNKDSLFIKSKNDGANKDIIYKYYRRL